MFYLQKHCKREEEEEDEAKQEEEEKADEEGRIGSECNFFVCH